MVNDSLKSPVFYTKVGIKKRPNDKVCSKSDFVNGLMVRYTRTMKTFFKTKASHKVFSKFSTSFFVHKFSEKALALPEQIPFLNACS